jgi:diaminopimelate epimerase
MGRPQFLWEEIPLAHAVPDPQAISFPEYGLQEGQNVHLDSGFAVNMGNPHIVFFVKPISNSAFQSLGPILENHELFPERVNVSFCTVENTSHLHLRVWERGAGPTKACGSGACAAAIAAISKGLADRSVKVTQQGGDLVIHWRMSDNHVLMNGPVIYCSMQPIPQAIGTKL